MRASSPASRKGEGRAGAQAQRLGGVVDLCWRQAVEQYRTDSQFFAQALRHVMVRPHTAQGLLGR